MPKLKVFIFFIFIQGYVFSQEIAGKIYGTNTVEKDIKIINITQRIKTFSGDNGDFKISAFINDSVSFSSLLYESKIIRVDSTHFKETLVIGLKEKINNLDKIVLTSKSKEFNIEKYNIEIASQINKDVKNNLNNYEKKTNGNIDFRKIGEQIIAKLFKKKG
jgi:hypothetical protein